MPRVITFFHGNTANFFIIGTICAIDELNVPPLITLAKGSPDMRAGPGIVFRRATVIAIFRRLLTFRLHFVNANAAVS